MLQRLSRVALLGTVLLLPVMGWLDHGLRTPHAPNGIVSFELAGPGAAAILAQWSEAQYRDALLLQGLDYLFLLAYASLLSTLALLVGQRVAQHSPRLASLASTAAWAAALSGVLDALENVPLIRMLRSGSYSELAAGSARLFASAKFVLLALSLAYLLLGFVAGLVKR